jgi:hypothetical protein
MTEHQLDRWFPTILSKLVLAASLVGTAVLILTV